jgi:hypothetical protein
VVKVFHVFCIERVIEYVWQRKFAKEEAVFQISLQFPKLVPRDCLLRLDLDGVLTSICATPQGKNEPLALHFSFFDILFEVIADF